MTLVMGCKGEEKREELVSVEGFKEYYQMNGTETTDEVIENYIFDYEITEGTMAEEDMLDLLNSIIKRGDDSKLGYRLQYIYGSKWTSEKPINEFIYDANWIYIRFSYLNPDRDEFAGKGENMLIDLKHEYIYFNCDSSDYRNAEESSELSDDDVEEIRKDFPTYMDKESDGENCGYGYEVFVVDGKHNVLKYEKDVYENANVLFDLYWKSLYGKCFGKGYK